MGALALHGLGRAPDEVLDWYQRYCARLDPAETATSDFRSLLDETEHELRREGAEALLAKCLPGLISGWARNAYHPLIRLAYGYHFQIDGEVAAGLAYMKWCGPDPQLEALATRAAEGDPGEPLEALSAVADAATRVAPGRRFDDCLRTVIAHPAFAAVARRYPDALPRISRMALSVFDQTHDFFALHLVTGAHAYRVLYPFAGALRDEIFSLGIFAGYASVGAPSFEVDLTAETPPPTSATLVGALQSDDDHDIKLAYSALSQARFYQDAAYLEAAERYLER